MTATRFGGQMMIRLLIVAMIVRMTTARTAPRMRPVMVRLPCLGSVELRVEAGDAGDAPAHFDDQYLVAHLQGGGGAGHGVGGEVDLLAADRHRDAAPAVAGEG